MSLFRSAKMQYYELQIPKQHTYQVVSKLGDLNLVQFMDAAADNFHKPYYNSVKRCQQLIHKISLIQTQLTKQKIDLPNLPDAEDILQKQSSYIQKKKITTLTMLDTIEEEINNKFDSIDKLQKSLIEFKNKVRQLEDYKYLLFKAREIFHTKKDQEDGVNLDKYTLQQMHFASISGIIYLKDMIKFTKMIFRATKGNSVLYTFNIPEVKNDEARTAFMIIVESGQNLLLKVDKICDIFGAQKYKIPSNSDEIFQKIRQIENNIIDTKQLQLITDKNYREQIAHCVQIGQYGYARLDVYRVVTQRQLIVFHTMNFLQQRTANTMIAKIWITCERQNELKQNLPSIVNQYKVQPIGKKPTHFQMTQFTAPFQQIVNTYGVPRYEQVNPALYAITVFPFYFGVMFGDIGHGGILLATALWLIYSKNGKKLLPDIFKIRYLLLLMGSFAFYAGWIYNQFFSIPLNVFGSCYSKTQHQGQHSHKLQGCVYPFGFDPKWFRASNDLNYFNSYKMKFAVIIGVFHMTFAIVLKMLNTYHFKSVLDFVFEWLPQQIFFFCTFGYMCFLIIYKWTLPWGYQGYNTANAPSIIGQMIALPLQLGSTQNKPLWNQQSQQLLQYRLLMISLICVPWMLFPKIIILWCKKAVLRSPSPIKKHQIDELDEQFRNSFNTNQQMVEKKENQDHTATSQNNNKVHGHHEEEDMSQIAVHQIIQTIQFVLSTISNTASYLRLWALSLAHGQLSKVFLEKTIGGGIEGANIPVILVGMYFFFSVTAGVIMGMDVMECFLHALRLQWVQFQSKFFKADGWKFEALRYGQPINNKLKLTRDEE